MGLFALGFVTISAVFVAPQETLCGSFSNVDAVVHAAKIERGAYWKAAATRIRNDGQCKVNVLVADAPTLPTKLSDRCVTKGEDHRLVIQSGTVSEGRSGRAFFAISKGTVHSGEQCATLSFPADFLIAPPSLQLEEVTSLARAIHDMGPSNVRSDLQLDWSKLDGKEPTEVVEKTTGKRPWLVMYCGKRIDENCVALELGLTKDGQVESARVSQILE